MIESIITHVYNLDKAQWTTSYYLPPEDAVLCAYYHSRGDMNWWHYDRSLIKYGKSGKTVFCGEFSAMLDRCPIGG